LDFSVLLFCFVCIAAKLILTNEHTLSAVPNVASLLYSNRGNRCFNIVRPLALEFGLLCMVRQPSADTHVI
jgi:hypothetical protein